MAVQTVTALVAETIDGDTFKTSAGDYVRLAQVCTPEVGQPGWLIARDALATVIERSYLDLEIVGMSYGRYVCEIWRSSDKLWVNAHMRTLGYTCS